MTVDERRQVLQQFLKDNNASMAYTNNMIARWGGRLEAITAMNELVKSDIPHYCLQDFHWDASPEGIDYWNNLNHIWLDKFK